MNRHAHVCKHTHTHTEGLFQSPDHSLQPVGDNKPWMIHNKQFIRRATVTDSSICISLTTVKHPEQNSGN